MDDDHFWFGRQRVCSAAEGLKSVEDWPVSGGSPVDYFYLCVIIFLDNIQHQVMILLSNHDDNSSNPWESDEKSQKKQLSFVKFKILSKETT